MKVQRWMSQQYFVFFMSWGIFLPYWTGWLVDVKQLTVGQAGLVMSCGLVARGLSTLFIFPYFASKWSNKTLLNVMGIGTFIALLCYIPTQSNVALIIITLVLHIFYPALMPALDSIASVLVQHKQLKHYGKSRSWGSIGFVVMGILLTVFTSTFGDAAILYVMLFIALIFVWLGFMQTPEILAQKPRVSGQEKKGMLQLVKVKHFGLVLLVVILLQAGHASYYNYGYIFLQEMDTPKILIGLIINVAVLSEIVFFAKADTTFAEFSIGQMLTFAALGATIRWILVFAFPNPIVFTIAQIFHACSFAMGHYAFVKFLNEHVPIKQIPNAQGMYSALALSWSTAVLTMFGGYLYEIEPRYAFLGMIISTIPSMLLAIWYQKLSKK